MTLHLERRSWYEQKWPDAPALKVTEVTARYVFTSGHVIERTRREPDFETLLARARISQTFASVPPADAVGALAQLCALELAQFEEDLLRGVVRDVQWHHWRWLADVTGEHRRRFEQLVRYEAAPPGCRVQLPCKIWTGATTVGGQKTSRGLPYGSFRVGKSVVRAHIFSALTNLTYRQLPHLPGHHVDHICERSLCVAPWHLESVPPLVNTARRWGAERGEPDGRVPVVACGA